MAETKFEIRVHKHYTVDMVEGGKSKPLSIAGTRTEAEKLLREVE